MDATFPSSHGLGRRGLLALFAVVALAFFALLYTPGILDPAVRAALADAELQADRGEQLIGQMAATAEGGLFGRQLTFLALGALGVLGLARRRGAALRPVHPLAAVVLLYVSWMAASVLWSDVPALAARRLASFALVFVAIAGALRQLDGEDVVEFTFLTTAAYLALGVTAEVVTGSLRPSAADYRFVGILDPNGSGQLAALLVLSAVALPRSRLPRWQAIAAVLAGFVVLYLTRSRSATAGAVSAVVLRAALTARPSRTLFATLLAAWLGCLGLLVAGDRAGAAAERAVLMGRPQQEAQSLNGRTILWKDLLRDVAERPLLGYGIGSYWTAENTQRIAATNPWTPNHAHSIFVEMLLEQGAPGLALFLVGLAIAMARAIRRFRSTGDPAAGFVLTLLVCTIVVGSLESAIARHSLYSVIVYWAFAFLAFREPTPP
jgi:O-antigen ligase